MKKIKVIPFIISILFPLVCTAFIVAYSYGAIGNYTTNQNKYDNYVVSDYFDEDGSVFDEVRKGIQLSSNKFTLIDTNVSVDDFKVVLYGHTGIETVDDEEVIQTAYTLYFYDINYTTEKYNTVDEFVKSKGVHVEQNSQIKLVVVKGTGEAAIKAGYDSLNTTDSSQSVVLSDKVVSGEALTISSMVDHNAKNVKEDTTVYAYRTTVFNTSVNSSFNNFSDLNDIYEDEIEDGLTVGEGYTLMLVNQFTKNSENVGFKTLATITLNKDQLLTGEEFEAQNGVSNGYNNDYSKHGYSYIKYIWPTLLWQGALTLALSGILGVLFYAIWSTEEVATDEQKRIKNLKASKKAAKKSK